MFAKRKYTGGVDGREMGLNRQPFVDSPSSFYGASSRPMYPSHPYAGQPPPASYPYAGQPPHASNPYAGQPPPFPVVRVRGLPFDCVETDVADFFHGLEILDILFVTKGGRFSGEAFCVMAHPSQVDYALQKNRQNMGRRYIEVFRGKRQEYYKAVAHEVADAKGGSPPRRGGRAKSSDDGKDLVEHTGVIRMRGLPYSAGKDDVVEFFLEFQLSEDSVHITLNSEGRPTGEAFVEFADAEESKSAMEKDRMMLGSRYVELFPSNVKEMEDAIAKGK